MSWVTSGAPCVMAARPPIRTYRTRWRPNSPITASGSKSGLGLLAMSGIEEGPEVPCGRRSHTDALFGGARERTADKGSVDACAKTGRHLEGVAGGPEQVLQCAHPR